MTFNKWPYKLGFTSATFGIATTGIIFQPLSFASFSFKEANPIPRTSIELIDRDNKSSRIFILYQGKMNKVSVRQNRNDSVAGISVSNTIHLTLKEAIKHGLCKDTRLKSDTLNDLDIVTIADKIRFNITTAYYDLQEADFLVGIKQATVEGATLSLRDARLLEQAGLGTQLDVSRGERELSNASEQLTRAIANQRIVRLKLATILKEPNIELIAADKIQEAGLWNLSLDETRQILYQKWADSNHNTREIDETSLRNEKLRQLDEEIRQRDGQIQQLDEIIEQNDGVSQQRDATVRLRDSARQLNEAIRKRIIVLEVETFYSQLGIKQKKIKIAELNVGIASEHLRLARLYFQAGIDDFESVIVAQTELETVRTDYLKAMINYNRAYNYWQWRVGYQKSSPSDTYFQELIQNVRSTGKCS